MPDDRLITPAEAAELLTVDPRTLRDWRREGVGPAWHAYTAKTIRYRQSDVVGFIAASYRTPAA